MTEADLLRCIEVLDKRRDKKENLKQFQDPNRNLISNFGSTDKQTASAIGISENKVNDARQIGKFLN